MTGIYFRGAAAIGVCLWLCGCAVDSHSVDSGAPRAQGGIPNPDAGGSSEAGRDDKALTNDETRALLAQGYRAVSRHGQIYYCHRETETGSRFDNTICRTAEEIKDLNRLSKEMAAKQQLPGSSPVGRP